MEKVIGALFGILAGILIAVVGIAHPLFAWNHSALASLRSSMGDLLTSIALGAAGVALVGSSLLALRKKS